MLSVDGNKSLLEREHDPLVLAKIECILFVIIQRLNLNVIVMLQFKFQLAFCIIKIQSYTKNYCVNMPSLFL